MNETPQNGIGEILARPVFMVGGFTVTVGILALVALAAFVAWKLKG